MLKARMTVTTGSNESVSSASAINPIRLVVLPLDKILIVSRVFVKVVCFE